MANNFLRTLNQTLAAGGQALGLMALGQQIGESRKNARLKENTDYWLGELDKAEQAAQGRKAPLPQNVAADQLAQDYGVKREAPDIQFAGNITEHGFSPDISDPHWDPGAYHMAEMKHYRKKLFENAAKKDELNTKIQMQHQQLMETAKVATAAARTGNDKAALKLMEKAYEQVWNGVDLQISKDGKSYKLISQLDEGKVVDEKKFKSKDELLTNMFTGLQSLIAQPEKFAKVQAEGYLRNQIYNSTAQWKKGEHYVATDPKTGKQVLGVYVPKILNTGTSQPVKEVYRIGGKLVPKKEWEKYSWKPLEKATEQAKASAEIGLDIEKTRTERAKQAKLKIEQLAALEKEDAPHSKIMKEYADLIKEFGDEEGKKLWAQQQNKRVAIQIIQATMSQLTGLETSEEISNKINESLRQAARLGVLLPGGLNFAGGEQKQYSLGDTVKMSGEPYKIVKPNTPDARPTKGSLPDGTQIWLKKVK